VKKIIPNNKVPLDNCELDIVNSEPMDTCCQSYTPPDEWPVVSHLWSEDQKTLKIFRENCDTDLPGKTKLKFIFHSEDDGFKDLAGNTIKSKTIKIKTAKK
jgi:hypothetical protein